LKKCKYINLNYLCPTSIMSSFNNKCKYLNMGQCNLVTMNDKYGDGSDHEVCLLCGMCITCGDCKCKKGKYSEFNKKGVDNND